MSARTIVLSGRVRKQKSGGENTFFCGFFRKTGESVLLFKLLISIEYLKSVLKNSSVFTMTFFFQYSLCISQAGTFPCKKLC